MPQYTPEELHSASKRVMKSLSSTNSKANKQLSKPAIPNSIGIKSGKISKSSRKRLRRKERTNLAGKPITDLLDALPQAEAPRIIPLTELKEAQVKKVGEKAKINRKAEKKLVLHEIQAFGKPKSLEDIKQSIAKMNSQ